MALLGLEPCAECRFVHRPGFGEFRVGGLAIVPGLPHNPRAQGVASPAQTSAELGHWGGAASEYKMVLFADEEAGPSIAKKAEDSDDVAEFVTNRFDQSQFGRFGAKSKTIAELGSLPPFPEGPISFQRAGDTRHDG